MRARPSARPSSRPLPTGRFAAIHELSTAVRWPSASWAASGSPSWSCSSLSASLPTSVLGGSLDVTLAQARYVLASVIVGLGPLTLAVFALPLYIRRAGWKRG